MTLRKLLKSKLVWASASTVLIISCAKYGKKEKPLVIKEDPAKAVTKAKEIREKIAVKLADGIQMSLWASDSLAPDPVAMSIDDQGRVYLIRTNRQKNSEFDIRGHRDWMTESIGLQTVEDRRAFLHKIFAPERSKENEWLKDLNEDGSHDWKDLAIEKDEVWRLEDTNNDGIADVSMRVLNDFFEEITDVAGGLLVKGKEMFIGIAPDLWRVKDTDGDGIFDKKTSISHGYGVHIGFSGHGMSGVTEGPDGRIYWNIGDIGANITTADGKKFEHPNSGIIARSNPDGSDFEIFASGLRNTHEFVFDEYGNLISSDNDGDHPGESERLVHVVEGSDAGWRSNWQYGKYTDPKNNKFNVWMDEKLFKPRWDGQAAYIIPPIMNYHNGPTGMVYNPGTALGSDWKNKFFLVEFVGTPTGSHIWSFGLKPKGASFVLDGEKDVVRGILPTGIQFGPDGALYAADWINGWDTKNYGRVWKLDVTKDKNDFEAIRKETKRLIQLNYGVQTEAMLYSLLSNADMRVRQKAQFELVNRGQKGFAQLTKAIEQRENQLARIHGIWGVGQLARQNKTFASPLMGLLKDKDEEIIAQATKIIGDIRLSSAGSELVALLKSSNPRIKFYAAEAIGRMAYQDAVPALIQMLETNNDEDVYIRHAGVLALSRIGKVEPIVALANNPSKALRTAAVLVLRRLKNDNIAIFLNDKDEYIVTEAARGINDDLSIPAALPALAATLAETRFTSEPLLRRAINAALRVGTAKEVDLLINFSTRTDIKDNIKAEALATLGTWNNPSVLDRVDGRYRGKLERDGALVKAKIQPYIGNFLKETNPETIIAMAGLLTELNIPDFNSELASIYTSSDNAKVKAAILPALNKLNYSQIEVAIKQGMDDKNESVRTVALSLLNNNNVSKESLPAIVNTIFTKGGIKEQQQMLIVLGKLALDKTKDILSDLIGQLSDKKLSPSVSLELKEAVDATGSEDLKAKVAAIKPGASPMDEYMESLFGGNRNEGRNIFNYNSTAQCVRCHNLGGEGGSVGPNLAKIGSKLTREQLLQALVEPSARLSPGYGTVSLKLKDGQEVTGILAKETEHELVITTSDAEPLEIPLSRIAKRENMPSSMPPMGSLLSKREIRDVVEFLSNLK
ncbi:heme-binding protein [Emticicia oligotrophica DSM 17448]|uniref:Heme-binding protein n=1 Tax=Emticicia oligotrophica (strain DSM 17448 / CIP 109782 / MTCC 6937 / GPTSA100-15) TaxID=929562 RepID=A0ABM5MYY2_EMTOG|nr:HEAT repeat domain-containing protein [Emticicia oligotrophica]AFK02385.1 heme-binding protein [Emticicia oligotrophica DSM 17448]